MTTDAQCRRASRAGIFFLYDDQYVHDCYNLYVMRLIFSKKTWWVVGVVAVVVILAGIFGRSLFEGSGEQRETATVERGNIQKLVTVSGVVKAQNAATLAFPSNGIVREVAVREGDRVKAGQILASLSQSTLLADYNDALAYLRLQEALRDEIIRGPREEARAVTETDVAIAKADLSRMYIEQDRIIENTLRTLYSTDLEARPEKPTNDDAPPIISGTYTCDDPQTYRFSIYPSKADSGYSYTLDSEGGGVFTAVTESPTQFGSCGLFIQFVEGQLYSRNSWLVDVPNKRGSSYTTNLNAYNLALEQRSNAIDAARQSLEKAEKEEVLKNVTPSNEELEKANANVSQAAARLASVEAKIADVTIRAPFDGVVTDVDIVVGEVGSIDAAITMIAGGEYDLEVRVPEIDITKISESDTATAVFDAKSDSPLTATINFISPLSTEIDGVAYYKAHLTLDETPGWIREGLNADVDVVTEHAEDVLRIPKRFMVSDSGKNYVLTGNSRNPERIEIELGLIGNEGYVEVKDLSEGTTIIAP